MHEALRTHDLPAERLAERLMAQTHAEDRQFVHEVADHRNAHARIGRRSRSRGDDDPARAEALDLLDRHLVVATHLRHRSQLSHILDQVVGERVVIVENEDHALGW